MASLSTDESSVPAPAPTDQDGPGPREDGPYILRPLLEGVPLVADGSEKNVKINCVEFHDGNLYIGTSGSEILHFVQIPPDPADNNSKPVFIPASRLSPVSADSSATASGGPGVQEILLLPRIGKACVLCNWTAAFYSLPELSPVSGLQVGKNCHWIGGVDLNERLLDDGSSAEPPNQATILFSSRKKLQVVRLADKVLDAAQIGIAGTVLSVRRDSIACVADGKSYALVDIYRKLQIPLMSISSLDDFSPDDASRAQEAIGKDVAGTLTANDAQDAARSRSHSRHSSRSDERVTAQSPSPPEASAGPEATGDAKFATGPPSVRAGSSPAGRAALLKPHIVSPNQDEFLLVVGTRLSEPGVGMFVSLDGEPTRATIQFERYPEQIIVDGSPNAMMSSQSGFLEEEDAHVIASMSREVDDGLNFGIEVQHVNAGQEANPRKHWLEAPGSKRAEPYGLRSLIGSGHIQLDEVVDRLSKRRFAPFPGSLEASMTSLQSADSRTAQSMERQSKEKELFEREDSSQDDEPVPEGWEAIRNAEEEDFTRRLASTEAHLAVWSGNQIWWAIRNPVLNQLDAQLDAACPDGQPMERHTIFSLLDSINARDAKTELEYMTFDYLRQKTGLLLLVGLLSPLEDDSMSEGEVKKLEKALIDSKLDPRVVLSLIPGVRNEIIVGRRGIWIYSGVKKVAETYLRGKSFISSSKEAFENLELRTMYFIRQYLSGWRKMKGFGSVPDEREVFRTVDAALLITLLDLDQRNPKGLVRGGVVRADLNELVDRGVDCFERAVDLLESHSRLFILSRLYQSRKMASEVLATWKRIIEGEEDSVPELADGEQRVKEYLKKVSNPALVEEYGIWLANRNPRLGVQVFAEEDTRAPKFEPSQAVEILRKEAPDAVKFYLEHLVFDKGYTSYVNELISYYLDVVLGELETSQASRTAVMDAYNAYRALQAPKPTYHHFLTENAPPNDEIWKSRLRLLQLLGGAQEYDVKSTSKRIGALPGDLLVPETIILAGRQRRHDEALRLLVHRLGDYDTAVAYCLRGGASVYSRPEGRPRGDSLPEATQQRRLFHVVLHEFLAIEDLSDRVEQTGALLERFGGWFEVDEVLRLVPDTWSVDVVAGYLTGALRRLVREKHESELKKALSGAANLRVNYDFVVSTEKREPLVQEESIDVSE